ncbi:helix-turn-helix domain-containing protein [Desulfosporosinus youngiae]|uniref:DNA-binding domain-containing protein, AraC-type n=1 Tax=Desulfosporosinus youngiae DSM 17734 TaxID=768710 RepID=H5Y456_9FIRM|nr:AraC family transcriptional regulator [Desulfosporosinus youngiae]EHQ89737.1 DNA-binding domain-containing protein, AraC-type [Desulfosporosinus youngiae DSM 17734]
MEVSAEEKLFYGHNITVIKREPDCTVYKMKDVCGEGTMTRYQVFPGIDLMYNDFYLQNCFLKLRPKVEMIGIDHCCQGCREWKLQNNLYMYLQERDLQKPQTCRAIDLPFSHYQGITIAIYIEEASNTLSALTDGFFLDLYGLRNKLCSCKRPFILKAGDSIQRIFSELYAVPDQIRENYFKIKVLELLLFLSVADVSPNSRARPYFPKNQVDAVREIRKYMTDHPDKHLTLEELSAQFGIPLTAMKACFKEIYGTSVYAYLRSCRIRTTANLLGQTTKSITDIARQVGYENPSKFAAAFKAVMNMPPLQYRNSKAVTPLWREPLDG